jgi:hypothetical protein
MDISLDFCPFATEYGKVAKEGWESIPADKQDIYGDTFWIMREIKALLSLSESDCRKEDLDNDGRLQWLIFERWAHITRIMPRLNYFQKKYQMDLSTASSVIDHIAQELVDKRLLSSCVSMSKAKTAISRFAGEFSTFKKEMERRAKEAAEKAAKEAAEKAARNRY